MSGKDDEIKEWMSKHQKVADMLETKVDELTASETSRKEQD